MGKGRAPCCDKNKVKKGPWSPAEDLRLITFIQRHGHGNWRSLPKLAGLLRCGKSCRLRWINYLRPDVKRGNFTKEEEETIIKLHQSLGNKWSKIASCFPGRTDNEIKNMWNTHLKKRLVKKYDNIYEEENDDSSTSNPKIALDEEPKQASSSSSSSSACSCAWDYSNPSRLTNEVANYNNISVNAEKVIEIPLPLESDVDFWSMLENLDSFHTNKSQSLAQELEAPLGSNYGEEYESNRETQCGKWLEFLENELGLE